MNKGSPAHLQELKNLQDASVRALLIKRNS